MRTNWSRCAATTIAAFVAATIGGCSSVPGANGGSGGPSRLNLAQTPDAARHLPIFDGHDGAAMSWSDVLDAIASADVIIVGEQHDDGMGHAVQTAIMEDVVSRWPSSALSMEMLERDEQDLVADYFDGVIDAKQFEKLTFSTNWGAKGMWKHWYQPTVDAARDGGGRVVAANAPRRYVRLARTDGYERLDALTGTRALLVDHPDALPSGGYRDRFWETMTSPEMVAAENPGADSKEHEPPSDETVESLFRSQLVWDTTMARSIARAREDGAEKVVHLVGQFHSDFEGGTVQQVRASRPTDRIVVISMQRARPATLREEDQGRADIVVYTGPRK